MVRIFFFGEKNKLLKDVPRIYWLPYLKGQFPARYHILYKSNLLYPNVDPLKLNSENQQIDDGTARIIQIGMERSRDAFRKFKIEGQSAKSNYFRTSAMIRKRYSKGFDTMAIAHTHNFKILK